MILCLISGIMFETKVHCTAPSKKRFLRNNILPDLVSRNDRQIIARNKTDHIILANVIHSIASMTPSEMAQRPQHTPLTLIKRIIFSLFIPISYVSCLLDAKEAGQIRK